MALSFRTLGIYVFLAMHLLAIACESQTSRKEQSGPVSLKVVVQPFIGYAPFYIAQEEGYFAEQGLKVDLIRMSDDVPGIAAVIQENADVTSGFTTISLINAIAEGAAIRLVADKGYYATDGCTYQALMVRRDLFDKEELVRPEQLKDRRIRTFTTTFGGYLVERILRGAGLTFEAVKTVEIPSAMVPEALGKGQLDAALASEPWLTRILRDGSGKVLVPAQQVIPDGQTAVVLFGRKLLVENRDAGKRFMVAYLKAVRQYDKGKTERNLGILGKYTGLEEELLRLACWQSLRLNGEIDSQSVLDFQEWAAEKGLLKRKLGVDQFWDPSFIEHADQVLGASTRSK